MGCTLLKKLRRIFHWPKTMWSCDLPHQKLDLWEAPALAAMAQRSARRVLTIKAQSGGNLETGNMACVPSFPS